MKRIRRYLRQILREESGEALVLGAVGMVAILSFAGLAIDIGQLRYEKCQLQAAADAAALAGALEISYCGGTPNCTALQTAAQQALTENGFTGSTLLTQCATPQASGLTLTVNNGPCGLGSSSADPNYGNKQYVEVELTEPQSTYFASIVGLKSVNLSVRAEAAEGNSPYCFDIIGPTGMTFQINGSNLTASCGVLVDSTSGMAMQANGATINATAISIAGGDQVNGGNLNPNPVTGTPVLPDPLSYLTPPTIGGCTYTSTYSTSSNATLSPGTYCGGIQINGGAVTLSPGVYVLENFGLQVNGGSLTGSGVTIYLQAGGAQFNGTTPVNLVAPTTGQYAGILFYQNPLDTSVAQINGGSGSVFQGALYFPGAQYVQLNGSNVAAYTIVDAKKVQMNGGNFALGNDYSSLPGGSPTKGESAVLAE